MKNKLNAGCILLLMIVLSGWGVSVYAQDASAGYSIRGIVKDSAGKGPLELTTVKLLSRGAVLKVTLTDKDGVFVFSGMAAGNYAVLIASIGYKTRSLSADVSGGATKIIDLGDIFIDTMATRLKEAVVTASKPIMPAASYGSTASLPACWRTIRNKC